MAIVYVKWYGNILEGELLDGECMGMKQVRIPLDGHHPVALFSSGHVYQTEADAMASGAVKAKPVQQEMPAEAKGYIADVYVNDLLERFKKSHWDESRNHLRVDALEEFYRLWRQAHCHKPDGSCEAQSGLKTVHLSEVACWKKTEQQKPEVLLPLKPPPAPVHHRQRRKDATRKNIVQLSLF